MHSVLAASNFLYKNSADINNLNIITILLKELDEAKFIYRIYIENKIDINKRIIKYKII